MRLDFVGVDPDNPNDQCPAVFVDPDTGDFYMQGETVTDPAVPELTDIRIISASSMTSAMSSEAPGTCRTSWTATSVPVCASPGTAARSCSPLSAGTTPALRPGSRVIAIVPPRENTSTRQDAGRVIATTCIPSLDTGKPRERRASLTLPGCLRRGNPPGEPERGWPPTSTHQQSSRKHHPLSLGRPRRMAAEAG
jgi:hypothetical protein